MRLYIEGTFDAAHSLHDIPGMSKDHPCSRVHGHTYRYKISISLLDEWHPARGWVVDAGEIKRWIKELFDHKAIDEGFYALAERIDVGCEDMRGLPETAENIAYAIGFIVHFCMGGVRYHAFVRVWETDSISAEHEERSA